MVFLLTINLGHGESLVGGGGDDLVGASLSLDWGEFPLLWGAVGWLVDLGDNFAISIVSDNLNLTIFLLVKGKTVELIVAAALGNKNLVPGLSGLLVITDHIGLLLPVVSLLAAPVIIEDHLVVFVLNMDLSLATENGTTTGGLLWVLDALLLGVVPVLSLGTLVLTPHALSWVTVQVLLATGWGRGLMVHVLLVALAVWSWVSLAALGGILASLAPSLTATLSQETSIAGFLRRGG